MKKKNLFAFVFSILFISFVALIIYNHHLISENNKQSVSYNYIYESTNDFDVIENSVKNSTGAVTAEFVSFSYDSQYFIYKFKVNDILYGNIPEKELVFRVEKIDSETAKNGYKSNTFIKGETYILPLLRFDDIFYETAQYYFTCSYVIPYSTLNQQSSNNNFSKKINELYNGDIISYIKNTAISTGYQKEEIKNIFRNENLETVVKNCDVIVKVKVENILTHGIYNDSTTYTCSLLNVINNITVNTDNETGYFYITTFKDALEINKEYYITLAIVDNTSTIYSQASPIGIIPAEDTEIITKIKNWLNE